MKKIMILAIISLLLSACGGNNNALSNADIQATALANARATIAFEQAGAGPTSPAGIQSPVSNPIAPPTAPPTGGNHYAWNYLGSIDSGGITIEVSRIILADKSAVPDQDFSLFTTFDDKPVVGMLAFKVINNTQQIISVYPDQGRVIIGSEQIELIDYLFGSFGDSIGGEIFPGVTKIGGLWFGVKRIPLAEIQAITINFSAPHDANFTSLGPDYTFTFDLSTRMNEPLPDELK